MPESADTNRKKPPTFQHLPVHRAKTLKRAWVEKTKIKSKWKAQKRKEGLESTAKLDLPVYEEEEGEESSIRKPPAANDKVDDTYRKDLPASPPPQPQAPRAQVSHLHPSRAHIHPDLLVRKNAPIVTNSEEKPSKKRKRKLSKTEKGGEADAAEPPSVRDLMKEAYSRSTLHTFKADPLNRHGRNHSGHSGRGPSETGRGQPNMKLRMNAMLAKIKQDYT
jgi:hypothetical protein